MGGFLEESKTSCLGIVCRIRDSFTSSDLLDAQAALAGLR